MKILVIDNDSKRINTLKSLGTNGHLVQVAESLTGMKEFLDGTICQVLMLGPERVTGNHLQTLNEWRQSLGVKMVPWIVALECEPDAEAGIDHVLNLPLEESDFVELSTMPGVPPETITIDRNAAMEICDGDEELFREIAKIFLGDGPGRIRNLKESMEQENWQEVADVAHLMKGSALNLSAGSLRAATLNLERTADAGNVSLIPFWFDQVVYEYGRLEKDLNDLANGLPGTP